MPNIGPMELIVVLVIALVVLGPKRLPGLGKQLGSSMREFKDGISGVTKDDDEDDRRAIEPAPDAASVKVEPKAETPAEQPAPKTSA